MNDVPSPNPEVEEAVITAQPKLKRRLHEAVFDELTTEILTGKIARGAALPADPMLSSRFGVSRTVIREAIQALAGAGLVDVRHGAGTYANGPDGWDLMHPQLLQLIGSTGTMSLIINDLLDIRRMFEVEAVTLAARRATREDILELERLVDLMERPNTTEKEHLDLNVEFHSAIVAASHNRILRSLREQLRGLLSVMMNARQRQADSQMRTVSNAMHRLIVSAIKERRPDRAQAVMLVHVQGAERTLELAEQSPH